MATISSHTLNSVDGTHAGGIAVTLNRIGEENVLIFSSQMDEGGRLLEDVDLTSADPEAIYELVFFTSDYWATHKLPPGIGRPIPQIVLRFQMPDPKGKYHMPLILAPNSYSTWASS